MRKALVALSLVVLCLTACATDRETPRSDATWELSSVCSTSGIGELNPEAELPGTRQEAIERLVRWYEEELERNLELDIQYTEPPFPSDDPVRLRSTIRGLAAAADALPEAERDVGLQEPLIVTGHLDATAISQVTIMWAETTANSGYYVDNFSASGLVVDDPKCTPAPRGG